MIRTVTLGLTVWLAANACSEHALAEDEYDAAMAHAIATKERAIDSHLRQDWQDAFNELRAADAIRTTPVSKYEMGLAASQLGLLDLAVENYTAALELGLSNAAAKKARAYVDEYSTQLARVKIAGPDGARVLMQGIERARLPHAEAFFVIPGSITIEAITESNERVAKTVTLASGQFESMSFQLKQPELLPQLEPKTHSIQHVVSNSEPLAQTVSREPAAAISANSDSTLRRTPFLTTDAGRILIATGTTMTLLSVVYVATSDSKIEDNQRALANHCAVQAADPNGCEHAKFGELGPAQSAANAIAKWRTIRALSWVGVIGGILTVATGTGVLVRANLSLPTQSGRVTLEKSTFECHLYGAF